MIEAVNSVLQNAPVIRASAEQTSTVDSFAVNPQRVQKAAQAPYISPYITVDAQTDKTVLQIRDAVTGKVLQQIPSQTNIEAQGRNQVSDAAQTTSATPQAETQAQTNAAAPTGPTINTAPPPSNASSQAATSQQLAAFATASRAGNTNAGSVSLYA